MDGFKRSPIKTEKIKELSKAFIESYKWIGLRLVVKTSSANKNYFLDIRTKRDDATSVMSTL